MHAAGDVNSIEVGEETNIQDNAVVHVAKHNAAGKELPTRIGSRVTIGHGAVIHAATVGDHVVVGMGATVMDGATLEPRSIVAAGSLVTPGTVVPSGQVWAGSPARFLRELAPGEAEFIGAAAADYARLAAVHAAENAKGFNDVELDKARRADRRVRDPEYDSAQGIARDVDTRAVVGIAAST